MHKIKALKIWLKSMKLTQHVYEVVSEFTKDEKFGVVSQVKPSAVYIPSNIAEGAGTNLKNALFLLKEN